MGGCAVVGVGKCGSSGKKGERRVARVVLGASERRKDREVGVSADSSFDGRVAECLGATEPRCFGVGGRLEGRLAAGGGEGFEGGGGFDLRDAGAHLRRRGGRGVR